MDVSVSRIAFSSLIQPIFAAALIMAYSPLMLYTLTGTSTDRKSTRLNSSHSQISYAFFCLKKKSRCLSPGSHRFGSMRQGSFGRRYLQALENGAVHPE